uniref:Zinc finger protein 268 n=1 Tax=Canis lupus familiaris TaxID=9615 RepID=A0A8C0PHK0_CANLF
MATRVRTSAIWGIKMPNLISSSSWNKEKNCGCRPKSQVKANQEKPGKLMIMWNGIRKIKISWKIWQKATNVHLGNHAFLVQIMFLQEKSFISMSHLERDL